MGDNNRQQSSTDLEAFTATTRNHELTQSLETGGQINTRDIRRNEARKNKFLTEVITIVITDDYGKIIPGCKFKFLRKKLSLKSLRLAMKRCPYPNLEIDYFCDNNGTALWMEEMLLKALPDPAYYIIVPRMKRQAVDIRKDPTYDGQTTFVVRDVPMFCKDGSTPVDMETLRAWFIFAINEEDPNLQESKAAIAEAKEFIAAIDKKIRGVPKIVFRDGEGRVMDPKRAEAEREVLYKAYLEERTVGEKQLKNKQESLRRFEEYRSRMGVTFNPGDIDSNTQTRSYYVRFHGTADAHQIEDMLLKKDDWVGIKLACGTTDPVFPPWVGRGQVPIGRDNPNGDYQDTQVNVAGAKFSRIPHGVGTIKMLDRNSASIAAERFEFFYGMWDTGLKMGHGIEVNDSGVYSGRFVSGLRDGHGRWDMADGSICEGNFGHSQQFADVSTTLSEFKNPYREGHPHGQVEITFGDGSFYRGSMTNGRINGYGEYQSGFNEVKVGPFKNGYLHGPNSMHINLSGETFVGPFVWGELHGEGRYANKKGDAYKGTFYHNLRHGRGDAEYGDRGVYRGYYINGLMTGKGELFFGRRPKAKKKKHIASVLDNLQPEPSAAAPAEEGQSKSPFKAQSSASSNSNTVPEEKKPTNTAHNKGKKDADAEANDGLEHNDNKVITAYKAIQDKFKKCYMGFMLADSILNGGAVMDTEKQIPSVLGRSDKQSTLPITILMRNILHTTKRIKRKLEKMTDMDNFVRTTIVKKKKSIFRQQRHYTKKTMYEDDMVGIRKEEFDGRQRVREDRLARINMDKLIPTLHMVDRIKHNVSDAPVTHLLSVFKHIKPDPEATYKTEAYKEGAPKEKLNRTVPKIVLSDFEELIERQRLIEYDAIWKQAEKHFINSKRAAAGGDAADDGDD